ncbi:uncharacterized protein LOC119075871 [Bradysia coprophila]|uniref:uncharacterized protein LOC119075871 n=1 Tax=Bradysia coprophila TaxID=38358 RepID=UPI00187D894B|nr:uncharacterized protein LOC119075871 [Bradysia coprophila]
MLQTSSRILKKIEEVLGHGGYMEYIPELAVVGVDGVGKSSVLNNFLGRDFLPRGMVAVTSTPIIIELVNEQEEWGEFQHYKGKRFHLNEICKEIAKESARIAGTDMCNTPIKVQIFSPTVPTVTLIDLPGIPKSATSDKRHAVETIIIDAINKDKCLILAVAAANNESIREALQLAEKVDPQGTRTVGVMTKLDLMDDGTNEIENRFEMHQRFVGLINADQNAEMEFIHKYPKFKDLVGITHLRKIIDEMMTAYIREKLEKRMVNATEDEAQLYAQIFGGVALILPVQNSDCPTKAKQAKLSATKIDAPAISNKDAMEQEIADPTFETSTRNVIFPKSPPFTYQPKDIVSDFVSVRTKGIGNILLPISLIDELSTNESSHDRYWISAARGMADPILSRIHGSTSRDVMLHDLTASHQANNREIINAMKCIDEHIDMSGKLNVFSGLHYFIVPTWIAIYKICELEINIDIIMRRVAKLEVDGPTTNNDSTETEQLLKSYQRNIPSGDGVVCIIDIDLQINNLTEKEKNKLKYHPIDVSLHDPSQANATLSHGTKVYKFVAAICPENTIIHFYDIKSRVSDVDAFYLALAFERILTCQRPYKTLVINCSLSVNPQYNPVELIDKNSYFFHLHNSIHLFGYVIFGAAGNTGNSSPHHPWGSCDKCIVVGACNKENKITQFSSGCCTNMVTTFARGTDFCLAASEGYFVGTSYSTAIVSASFVSILDEIWDVNDWQTITDSIRKYLREKGSKKIGCSSSDPQHQQLEWIKLESPNAAQNTKVILRVNGIRTGYKGGLVLLASFVSSDAFLMMNEVLRPQIEV